MFTICSDPHIRQRTWASRPDLNSDSYYSFAQVVSYSLARHYNLVLGGDTFQSTHPHAEDIKFFRTQLRLMKEAGLKVFYIQGQHDYSDPPWPEALSEEVVWVHNKVFEPCPGIKIFALDHMRPAQLQEALKAVPADCHIVMLHQLAQSVFPLEGTWDFSVDWLPAHVDVAIMGDYHQPVDFHWGTNKVGFYTGSMHVQSIDEPKEKSFVHAGLDRTGAFEYQRIPLVTRAYFNYPVNSEEELDALVRWLNAYDVEAEAASRHIEWDVIKKPVVEVPHLTSIKEVKSRLEAAAGGKVHLWLKPFNVEIMQGPITISEAGTRASLETSLKTYVEPGLPEYDFILELLSQPSEQVFARWKERLGLAAPKQPGLAQPVDPTGAPTNA